ncbi:hypothetical protein B0H63DRAFT_560332 [Podospora didyma]|uniref:Uncharacterized protein n=1 Tax=Podospora didyma TaxID=330526 RepID=A0AAE0U075_9PEZI|nr:hypothetical protein B0H63DRAFT_560332 [Podospora didyma]
MVPGDMVRREYVGEGLWALPKQGKYKWYYLKDHSPDEVAFLKVADSRKDFASTPPLPWETSMRIWTGKVWRLDCSSF